MGVEVSPAANQQPARVSPDMMSHVLMTALHIRMGSNSQMWSCQEKKMSGVGGTSMMKKRRRSVGDPTQQAQEVPGMFADSSAKAACCGCNWNNSCWNSKHLMQISLIMCRHDSVAKANAVIAAVTNKLCPGSHLQGCQTQCVPDCLKATMHCVLVPHAT